MQVYNIIIDEKQRKLIEKALSAIANNESLEFLRMIKDLPEIEKAQPGIVHGLCY